MNKQKLMVLVAFACLLGVAVIIGCTTVGEGFLVPAEVGLELFAPKFLVAFSESPTPEVLSVFKVDATTGGLTAAASSPVNTHIGCCAVFIDIDPQSRFVYVPNTDGTVDANDNTVSVYSLDQSTGALTEVAGSPFGSGGTDPIAARVHPSGSFLYVNNRTSPNIAVFSVNTSTGALTAVGAPVIVSGQLVQLIMDPLGRFLYATACGTNCDTSGGAQPDQVFAFSINQATGALTAAGTAATGKYPRTGAVDAVGNFLFVTAGDNDFEAPANALNAFSINSSTGALTAVSGSPFTTADGAYGAAIPPNSGFLVTGARDANTLQVWKIGSNGALTQVSGSPFTPSPALNYEHGVFSEPSGKFGYVLDGNNDQIRIGSVNPSTGALTETAGSPVTTGGLNFPVSIAVGH